MTEQNTDISLELHNSLDKIVCFIDDYWNSKEVDSRAFDDLLFKTRLQFAKTYLNLSFRERIEIKDRLDIVDRSMVAYEMRKFRAKYGR